MIAQPPNMADQPARSRMLADAAEALASAGAEGQRIALLSAQIDGLSVDEAYAIARTVFAKKGEPVAGYKLGYTNAAIRAQMNICEPNYGRYGASARLEISSGSLHVPALLAHPRLEPEVTVVLGQRLCGPDVRASDVFAAIDSAYMSFEVVDTRYRSYEFTACDNIADGSSGALCIMGNAIDIGRLAAMATLDVEFYRGSERIDQARIERAFAEIGDNIAWLANRLSGEGEAIEAGAFIMTGALTRAHELHYGMPYRAEIAGLGTISCVVEKEQRS